MRQYGHTGEGSQPQGRGALAPMAKGTRRAVAENEGKFRVSEAEGRPAAGRTQMHAEFGARLLEEDMRDMGIGFDAQPRTLDPIARDGGAEIEALGHPPTVALERAEDVRKGLQTPEAAPA